MSSLFSRPRSKNVPAWMLMSACCRWRSSERTTWASPALSRYLCTLSIFSLAYCLRASVASRLRKVMLSRMRACLRLLRRRSEASRIWKATAMRGKVVRRIVGESRSLVVTLSFTARQNAQNLAVFSHRPPSNLDSLGPEQLDDLLIRIGARRILTRHQLLDVVFHRLGGNVVSRQPGDRGVEEVLELEDSLGRMDVLAGGHPRHRGLVHPDVLSHVPQNQGFEVGNAPVEEVALELYDGLGHLVDRPLPLMDRADQPHRAAKLVLDELLGLPGCQVPIAQRVSVGSGDSKLRQAVVVEDHRVLVAQLVDEDVRGDVLRVVAGVVAAGLGIELLQKLGRGDHLRERDLEVLGYGGEILGLQVLHVPLDNRAEQRGARILQRAGLDQQALLKVARAAALGVEVLNPAQGALGDRHRHIRLRGQRNQRISFLVRQR